MASITAGNCEGPFDGQIKTVIEERVNEQGQRIRITRRIRMKLIRETVDADVAARTQWAKYGDSRDDPAGPNLSTTVLGEPVFLNLSADKDHDHSGAKNITPAAEAKSIICRFCQGLHWSFKCPLKDSLAEEVDRKEKEQLAAAKQQQKGDRYVPPSLRGKDGREELASLPESYPVRLTNLADITSEMDIRSLCGHFGHVSRVYVAKDDRTGRCRGFAIVNFENLEAAEQCIARLNGHTYGNLILKAEMGQPRA